MSLHGRRGRLLSLSLALLGMLQTIADQDDDEMRRVFQQRCLPALTADGFDECVVQVASDLYSVCRHNAACISRGRGGFVFLKHMRKAGGTTLRRLISEHACSAWRADQPLNKSLGRGEELSSSSSSSLPPIGVYADEMRIIDDAHGITKARQNNWGPFLVATAMREPISRIISSYWFEGDCRSPQVVVKRDRAKVGHPVAPPEGCTLRRWVEDTEDIMHASRKGHSSNLWNDVSDYHTHVLGGFPGHTRIGEQHYRRAVARLLLDVDFVLITEQLLDASSASSGVVHNGGINSSSSTNHPRPSNASYLIRALLHQHHHSTTDPLAGVTLRRINRNLDHRAKYHHTGKGSHGATGANHATALEDQEEDGNGGGDNGDDDGEGLEGGTLALLKHLNQWDLRLYTLAVRLSAAAAAKWREEFEYEARLALDQHGEDGEFDDNDVQDQRDRRGDDGMEDGKYYGGRLGVGGGGRCLAACEKSAGLLETKLGMMLPPLFLGEKANSRDRGCAGQGKRHHGRSYNHG